MKTCVIPTGEINDDDEKKGKKKRKETFLFLQLALTTCRDEYCCAKLSSVCRWTLLFVVATRRLGMTCVVTSPSLAKGKNSTLMAHHKQGDRI